MIWWRLDQKWGGLPLGSVISDEKYKKVYYLDKPLFTPISDDELENWIEYKDESFCSARGIDKLLFYNKIERDFFLEKELHK